MLEFVQETSKEKVYQTAKISFQKSSYTLKCVPNDSDHRKTFVASSREFIGQCCRLTETDKLIFLYNSEEIVIGIASYPESKYIGV